MVILTNTGYIIIIKNKLIEDRNLLLDSLVMIQYKACKDCLLEDRTKCRNELEDLLGTKIPKLDGFNVIKLIDYLCPLYMFNSTGGSYIDQVLTKSLYTINYAKRWK